MNLKRFALLVVLLAWSGLMQAAAPQTRQFTFVYSVQDAQFPTDAAVDLYVPVPVDAVGQRVLSHSVSSEFEVERGHESTHGNAFYHLHRAAGDSRPIVATFSWTIERDVVRANSPEAGSPESLAPYLGSNRLVPVGHEVLDPILGEVRAARKSASQPDTARAIYDWVVDNVEYKKVGTGWGNGDTFWACSERYGNCTDFHALFTALARSEGIPARFEIGFPVPLDRRSGKIGGYHCWVQFYLPGEGWVPIDASEAAKHPEMREALYGSHPADRILFSIGRDLVFSDATRQQPLNYFIYPHVEIGGKAWTGKVPTAFSFEEASRS